MAYLSSSWRRYYVGVVPRFVGDALPLQCYTIVAMKHAILILATTFSLVTLAAPPVVAGDAAGDMASWTYRASADKQNGYKLSSDQHVLLDGKPATFVQSQQAKQDASKFYAAPFQEFGAKQYAGKRVRLTAMLKASGVQGAAGIWFKVKARDHVVAFDDMESSPVRGTSDWRKYSLVLDVPPRADRISVGVWLNGGGKVWFGDFALAEVDKTKVTARTLRWDPQKYWRFAEKELPREPNLVMTYAEGDQDLENGWTCHTSKSPSKCGVDRDQQFQGKPSAFIEQQANDPTDFVSSFQDISAADYLGKRVKFTAFLKTKGVTDWSGLWMRVDSGKNVLAFDNMADRPVKGDSDWAEKNVVLEVPTNATRIRFGFMQAGSGKSWMNSCRFDVVDNSVPVTAAAETTP